MRQWRETGDLTPLAYGGGKPRSLSERQRQALKRKIECASDLSLHELQAFLRDKEAVAVHPSTISWALARLGLSRKKSVVAAERNSYKRAWY